MERTRVDRWLWSVRLYKTRSGATDACRAGHVSVNGQKVKPAFEVKVGDRVQARVGDRDREVEVVRVIDTRVGAPVAAECLVDHSRPPTPRDEWAAFGQRERGAGRPSKRDRRLLDRAMGRGGRPAAGGR